MPYFQAVSSTQNEVVIEKVVDQNWNASQCDCLNMFKAY